MKLNCPACGEPFEDESDLGATLKLVEHLKNIPETEHIAQLGFMLKDLERLVAQDENHAGATASEEIRKEVFEKSPYVSDSNNHHRQRGWIVWDRSTHGVGINRRQSGIWWDEGEGQGEGGLVTRK